MYKIRKVPCSFFPFWAPYDPKNSKQNFSPKKSFWSILSLYAIVTYKKSEKLHELIFHKT